MMEISVEKFDSIWSLDYFISSFEDEGQENFCCLEKKIKEAREVIRNLNGKQPEDFPTLWCGGADGWNIAANGGGVWLLEEYLSDIIIWNEKQNGGKDKDSSK